MQICRSLDEVGKDHKFVVINNKKNQRHRRILSIDNQDKQNKINDSEADTAKQKFLLWFSKNKRVEVTCEISCVLELYR
jgi:hypothetical protein